MPHPGKKMQQQQPSPRNRKLLEKLEDNFANNEDDGNSPMAPEDGELGPEENYDGESSDNSFEARQIKISKVKYEKLVSIKQDMRELTLPGLPQSVRAKKRIQRTHQSVGRLGEIQQTPATVVAVSKGGNLLSTPSRIKALIQYSTEKAHRNSVSSSYKKIRTEIVSRESPRIDSLRKFITERVPERFESVNDYHTKLVLEKAQIRLKNDLFVPLASRQCESRVTARSISAQKVVAKNSKRRRKLRRLLKNDPVPPKVVELAPLNVLERASTVYKNYGPVGLGRFPTSKYMAQTIAPIKKAEGFLLFSSKK